ncbi:MAG: hypothetical protein ACM34J_01460 [Ignavibacteria bacterium]
MKKLKYFLLLALFIFSGCKSSILDGPSTTINFSIPKNCYVKLTVENSYNTIIATLVDGQMGIGSYAVDFDSENLAEGIYFYILEARGTEDSSYYKNTKQMLLIK